MASNLAVLTQSHTAVAAKKRAKREQIKEILFDDNARRYAVFQSDKHGLHFSLGSF